MKLFRAFLCQAVIFSAALFVAALLRPSSPAFAEAGKLSSGGGGIEVNPLISFRQQMREVMRDCQNAPNHPNCLELKKRLETQYEQLRHLCRENPTDERCGSIMKEKKSAAYSMNSIPSAPCPVPSAAGGRIIPYITFPIYPAEPSCRTSRFRVSLLQVKS